MTATQPYSPGPDGIFRWRTPGVTGPIWTRGAVRTPREAARVAALRDYVATAPDSPEKTELGWLTITSPAHIDTAEALMGAALIREALT